MKASYPPWLDCHPQFIQLTLKVKPASRVNALSLDDHHRLLLALKASPIEGKANKLLIVTLAKWLGLTQKQIIIHSGHHARDKKIQLLVEAEAQKQILERLNAMLKKS